MKASDDAPAVLNLGLDLPPALCLSTLLSPVNKEGKVIQTMRFGVLKRQGESQG